jgi:hypothetical protein
MTTGVPDGIARLVRRQSKGQRVVIVSRIEDHRGCTLLQIVDGRRLFRSLFGLCEYREEDRRKDSDDRDNNEKFNKCKGTIAFHRCPPSGTTAYML